jgi:hypothetical protein
MNEFDTIFNKNNVELHHSLTNIEKKKKRISSNLLIPIVITNIIKLSYQNENRGENKEVEEEKHRKQTDKDDDASRHTGNYLNKTVVVYIYILIIVV